MITESIKQKWPTLTISVLDTTTYRGRGHMITIGRIPKRAQVFFRPLRQHLSKPAWGHFWALVMAITISHGATLERLVRTLRGSTHRTNHGEFLWRSAREDSWVLPAAR